MRSRKIYVTNIIKKRTYNKITGIMSKFTEDVYGTTFELSKKESYCAVGEFIQRDGLVDRTTGLIPPKQERRIAKSMYWFYLYTLWNDNPDIPPMSRITDYRQFPDEMNRMLYTFLTTSSKYAKSFKKTHSYMLDDENKMMRGVHRKHLLEFVNHIVGEMRTNPAFILKLRRKRSGSVDTTTLSNHRGRNKPLNRRSLENRELLAERIGPSIGTLSKGMTVVEKRDMKTIDNALKTQGEQMSMLLGSIEEKIKKKPSVKIQKEVVYVNTNPSTSSVNTQSKPSSEKNDNSGPIVVKVASKITKKNTK